MASVVRHRHLSHSNLIKLSSMISTDRQLLESRRNWSTVELEKMYTARMGFEVGISSIKGACSALEISLVFAGANGFSGETLNNMSLTAEFRKIISRLDEVEQRIDAAQAKIDSLLTRLGE